MSNAETSALRAYHDATKHSLTSVRTDPHTLDWDIQPIPYKIYETLAAEPLPRTWPVATMPALDLAALARVLHLTAGIVRKAVAPGGHERYFRAAACTGALYHIDLYVIAGALPDLAAGVYHFGVHDFALRRLRTGDHRATVLTASADAPALAAAPVVLAAASTYWRNAWKYQARAYRHCFWDTGTILANLLAVATAGGLAARIVLGWVDRALDELLALDPAREGTIALAALTAPGSAAGPPPPAAPPVEPLTLATVPLSTRAVDYPEIPAAHAASALASADEVRAWRDGPSPALHHPPATGTLVDLPPAAPVPDEPLDMVIRRRGSTRAFDPSRTIPLAALATILTRATAPTPTDCLDPAGAHLADVYLIVHAVDDLAPGSYVWHPGRGALEQLRAGTFRREAGLLGLGQALPAEASAALFLLTDLDAVLARYGNRGYRAAQLDAAIMGGRIYLAAYALRLGATGLTFFDDDVTTFFSPHAAAKSPMFLMAVGRGQRRRTG